MDLSAKLKALRKRENITQVQLANIIGVERSSVGKYETGTIPSMDVMQRIANYFNVSVDYLIGQANLPEKKPAAPRRKGVRIPVLGQVPAGIPIEAITDFDYEDPDDWEEITEDMAASGNFFALRIKGDSMTPTICDGDIVIVRQQEDVNSGEIAIVMVNGDDATCKRVVKQTQGISLVANNPAYEPRFFTNKEIMETPVRVIGKVVELRRSF